MPDTTPTGQLATGSYDARAGDHNAPIVNVYQQARPQPVDDQALAAARARLEALPVDRLPEPAPNLPKGSRISFARNPMFTGRAGDLKQLARALKGGGTAAAGRIAALTGPGGIGKTQLAVEFAHRYAAFFAGGVFWLSFASPDSIPTVVAQCGGADGMDLRPDFAGLKLDEQVRLVSSAWQDGLPRLLVFDNCESDAPLADWRPRAGNCRVLVTSRQAVWDTALGVQTLQLGALSRAEGSELLRRFRPDMPAHDEYLAAIGKELGYLPLALHLAGSYLRRNRHGKPGRPEALLAELRRRDLLAQPALEGLAATFSPDGHEQHAARAFAVSHAQLKPDSPTAALARQALARAACLAPGEVVPRELLKATLPSGETDGAGQQAEDALLRLVDLGLLEKTDDVGLRLHPLLGAFVRGVNLDAGAADAVEIFVLAEAKRINVAGNPAPLLAWQPHLRWVTQTAEQRGSERAAILSNELGYHLRRAGDFAGARAAYERALKIDEAVYGPDHPNVSIRVNNLGSVLRDQGDLAAARAAFERALKIFEATYGSNHQSVATACNNLGGVLRAQGDTAGARAAYARALRILTETLGPDHPKTKNVQARLASLPAV